MDAQGALMIPCPRTPEEIVHNVILRQLIADQANPPEEEPPDEALELLRQIQEDKDAGKPLDKYVDPVTKIIQGQEAEERLTLSMARRQAVRQMQREMREVDKVGRFLHRCVMSGKLTISESIVWHKMKMDSLRKQVEELSKRLEESGQSFTVEDITKMDYSLQVTEKTVSKQLEGTTPQGREIVRKIVFRARRKLFEAQVPK